MGEGDLKKINEEKLKEKGWKTSLNFQSSKLYNHCRLKSFPLLPTMAGTYLQPILQCSLSPAGERPCFFTPEAQET